MDEWMETVGEPLHYFRQRTFCTYIILNHTVIFHFAFLPKYVSKIQEICESNEQRSEHFNNNNTAGRTGADDTEKKQKMQENGQS